MSWPYVIFSIVAAAYLEGRVNWFSWVYDIHLPSEMIDKGIRVIKKPFQENERFLFLERTQSGYRSLIEGLVDESTMLSESGSTA